jgi:hypothetical protein
VADFGKMFDPAQLDGQQLGMIEYVLNSNAYTDTFKPYLQSIRETLSQRLLDPSKDRKEEHPDDFLRGGIVAVDGLLNFFDRIVAETQMDRIARAMGDLTPEQQYQHDREQGKHVPVLGANEPDEAEYRAEDDF